MKKTVYSKINSYRKKDFRIQTKICIENNKAYVEKAALTRAAISHIQGICKNYERVRKLYKNIEVICPETVDERTVRFPFVDGERLSFDDESIFEFNEEYICDFKLTDGFEKMFPGCRPKEGETAVCPANLDGITENFVQNKDGIFLFDYEWITDFPVPISFLRFRTLYKAYQSDQMLQGQEYLSYMASAGFDEAQCELYLKMEESLQARINIGDRAEPIVSDYLKPAHTIDDMVDYAVNIEKDKSNIEKNRLQSLINRLSESFVHGAYYRYKYKKYKKKKAVLPDFDELLTEFDAKKLDITVCEAGELPQNKYDRKLLFSVDTENNICSNEIILRGWVSKPWDEKAFFDRIQIALIGDKSYTLSTYKELRNDLKYAFPYQEGVEGCGFVSFVSDKDIQKGKYKIGILCDGYYIDTQNHIELI